MELWQITVVALVILLFCNKLLMRNETKQGIEDYEEQEDSSDSENEDGTAVTSARYDEVCILKTCSACFRTTIKFTHSFFGARTKKILMNRPMKVNMMITMMMKMRRLTTSIML